MAAISLLPMSERHDGGAQHDGCGEITVHTAAERPGLWDRGIPSVWSEYNKHGDVISRWWDHLDEDLPEFQFVLYDPSRDVVVAEGHTGPLSWDGDDGALPDGIDAAIEQISPCSRSATCDQPA